MNDLTRRDLTRIAAGAMIESAVWAVALGIVLNYIFLR
jgi:hypothetical protein